MTAEINRVTGIVCVCVCVCSDTYTRHHLEGSRAHFVYRATSQTWDVGYGVLIIFPYSRGEKFLFFSSNLTERSSKDGLAPVEHKRASELIYIHQAWSARIDEEKALEVHASSSVAQVVRAEGRKN